MRGNVLEIGIVGLTAYGHARDDELTLRSGRQQRRPEETAVPALRQPVP